MNIDSFTWTSALFVVSHLAGVLSALHALGTVRTSQGTIAWCVALLSFPLFAVPLYWVFGRTKFNGYTEAIRGALRDHDRRAHSYRDQIATYACDTRGDWLRRGFDVLTPQSFTRGNSLELLIDGRATYDAIFAAIDRAERYVLVQFFILRDDDSGRELRRRLIDRASAGVQVYLLYDEIGCSLLPDSYFRSMREAGIRVHAFGTTRGRFNRFQLNFRNHRKIVIVDGRVALVGGLNIGDEYLGKDPALGYWRDTHLEVRGPAVQTIQTVFAGDWYWAQREPLDHLCWEPTAAAGGRCDALTLATGPNDVADNCSLMFVHAINQAERRLWIATPYFIPDEAVTAALVMAARRGVDVRVLIAGKPDHYVVYWASFSFQRQLEELGVPIHRYRGGILHEKVFVVDEALACVSTANLDNRSFRLNFELSVLSTESNFVREVAEMLERDLRNSDRELPDYHGVKGHLFWLAVRAARLFAPVL